MTTDAIADSTETQQGKPRYMSSLERQQLLREIAVGHPLWVIAQRYDRTYQWIRLISSQCKEEIAEIRRELGEEMNILWAQDMMYRAMELQHSIEQTRRQQRALVAEAQRMSEGTDMPPVVSEFWHKLDAHAAKLLHQLGEMLGQLPTRSQPPPPEQGKATYEIPGVDLGEVTRSWEQPVEVPK